MISYWSDDVVAKLFGVMLLCRPQQQLHTVLHMPGAHSFHSYGLWGAWHFEQV